MTGGLEPGAGTAPWKHQGAAEELAGRKVVSEPGQELRKGCPESQAHTALHDVQEDPRSMAGQPRQTQTQGCPPDAHNVGHCRTRWNPDYTQIQESQDERSWRRGIQMLAVMRS